MGRPRKYNDIMKSDGRLIGGEFSNESEMCDYVEGNICSFSEDILASPYISHEREYKLYRNIGPKARKGSRTDFFIESAEGPIVVEVKSPKQPRHELNRAISQLLAQGSDFKKLHGVFPRMILLVSCYYDDIADVIKDFNLPIEVVVMSKDYAVRMDLKG